MVFFELESVAQGWKYRLTQKDDGGLVQFLRSGGTFRTREEATIAMTGLAKELSDEYKPKENKALDACREYLRRYDAMKINNKGGVVPDMIRKAVESYD